MKPKKYSAHYVKRLQARLSYLKGMEQHAERVERKLDKTEDARLTLSGKLHDLRNFVLMSDGEPRLLPVGVSGSTSLITNEEGPLQAEKLDFTQLREQVLERIRRM